MNCLNDGTLSLHQFSIQPTSARRNSGFSSSFFDASPKMRFENLSLELEIIHHVLKVLKTLAHFFSQENN